MAGRVMVATLTLCPVSWQEACAFIGAEHSHHRPPRGWKFGVAVHDGTKIVGVATVGRPVARLLDNGVTLEVTRCCTDKTRHVASMLYGAAARAAFALGYTRLITYTLWDEAGTSLIACQWRDCGPAGGGRWSRPNRPRDDAQPIGLKRRWEKVA
jgi:hypothetical protein